MVGEVGMCRGPSDLPNPKKNDIKLFFRYKKKNTHTKCWEKFGDDPAGLLPFFGAFI